jgi:uncharacterized protein YndB with AHSA1/START domain
VSTDTIPPVRKQILVEAPPAHAFAVFTDMTSWWPLDSHHIGAVDAAEAVIEPFTGGRWYERGIDGSTCEWGRVLAWEPPDRLVLAWEISFQWQHDATRSSEVEIRFLADGPDRTRVELEHRGLDIYGADAARLREVLESPGGWNGLLEPFAARTLVRA